MLPKPMSVTVAVAAIFVGVLLLLGNMGVISNQLMSLWPVVLIVAGLVGLLCTDPEKRQLITKRPSKKKK